MKTILALIIGALAVNAQSAQPTPIVEARLTTPLNTSLAGVTTAPQLTIFVGVQNPALGVTYTVTVTVQSAKQSYSASAFVQPPIAPATMSAVMIPISMQPGDSIPAGGTITTQIYVPVTGPNGIPVSVKVN